MRKQSVLIWSLLPVLFASLCAGQVPSSAWQQQVWQQQVRKYAAKQDWDSALRIVDERVARFPQDMDVRSWRARVLTWSGKLDQAEQEYLRILAPSANDPDNWMGLATIYASENRNQDALHALDRATALDPKRADLHLARGRVLRALNENPEAKAEFKEALILDPGDNEARNALTSFRPQPRHELLMGTNTDLFSFMDAGQQESIRLISRWNPRWETSVGGSFYRWAGVDAQKLNASVTGKSKAWGSLTVGGGVAQDGGVIPKHEALFAYDRGWKLVHLGLLRGLETNYEQHWYWYSTAKVLALNGTTIVYFPRDWTWSLRLTAANSQFPGTPAGWRPAGMSKIGFPIKRFESRQLGGNIFFATGTENYSQVEQIGYFSSHTYGGGLHFQVAAAQDVSGFAGYETRTQGLNQITFGLTYGIRF
jgi:tetratricopeptide (TPR) repeat protein